MGKQSQSITLELYAPTIASGWHCYLPQSSDHLEELKEVACSVDQRNLEVAVERCMGSLTRSRPARVPAFEKLGAHAIGKGERRIVVPWFVGITLQGNAFSEFANKYKLLMRKDIKLQ